MNHEFAKALTAINQHLNTVNDLLFFLSGKMQKPLKAKTLLCTHLESQHHSNCEQMIGDAGCTMRFSKEVIWMPKK